MKFDAVEAGPVGSVFVQTSNDGGLSGEQITELCCNKIVNVSDSAPDVIRDQAHAFERNMKNVVLEYVKMAMRSERDRCVQIALKGGYKDLADVMRRV